MIRGNGRKDFISEFDASRGREVKEVKEVEEVKEVRRDFS